MKSILAVDQPLLPVPMFFLGDLVATTAKITNVFELSLKPLVRFCIWRLNWKANLEGFPYILSVFLALNKRPQYANYRGNLIPRRKHRFLRCSVALGGQRGENITGKYLYELPRGPELCPEVQLCPLMNSWATHMCCFDLLETGSLAEDGPRATPFSLQEVSRSAPLSCVTQGSWATRA